MTNKFKMKLLATSLMAASSAGVNVPVYGQSMALEEIFVTARRRDESVQDAPLSVNALADEKLKEYNITNFSDLGSLVAGLTLDEDVIASGASIRGIKYEVLAQADASVEFYLNDSHVVPLQAIQKMFDVGRVEVLRGPQGTLRGRASPSGSISVTTAPAETDVLLGYIDASLSDDGDQNYQGAVNFPVIEDKLGVRLAGFWDESNLNDVSSAFGSGESNYEGNGYRLSVTALPVDNLSVSATYERIRPDRKTFTQVESVDGAALSIRPGDRKSVQDIAETSSQDLETTTFNIVWDITDSLAFYYTGGYHSVVLEQFPSADATNALDNTFPNAFQGARGYLYNDADTQNHEIRLQSTEPLFDKLDFVVGAMYEDRKSTVVNSSIGYINDMIPDFIYGFVDPSLSNIGTAITETTIRNYSDTNDADTQESSVFLNLTYHFTDDTSLSIGGREIKYNNNLYIALDSGTVLQNLDKNEDTEIFTASLSHHFNPDLLGYLNWGTSWRAGPNLVGVFANSYSDRLDSFINMPSETSESFELGMKSSWFESRMQLNIAVYRQEFEDLSYRSPDAIYFDTDGFVSGPVSSYNLQAAVPVIVNGVEIEAGYVATENLTLNALLNYAKGEIDNGVVPCNDYNPTDGVGDSTDTAPTLGQIQGAVGGDVASGGQQVTACTTDQQTNTAPDFSATLSAEYTFDVGELDAYVRGLYSYYGSTDNSPTNPLDDVDSYGILNLYTGLRAPEGTWSVMLYVKNVADTEKVLNRDPIESRTIANDQLGGFLAGSSTVPSNYRAIEVTKAREFGVNFRYNF